ncbi:MAG TPA: CAP domain-containing protein [Clostridia bacterium]|nr:CAP domain-containing protein [Clostridia bacterium]
MDIIRSEVIKGEIIMKKIYKGISIGIVVVVSALSIALFTSSSLRNALDFNNLTTEFVESTTNRETTTQNEDFGIIGPNESGESNTEIQTQGEAKRETTTKTTVTIRKPTITKKTTTTKKITTTKKTTTTKKIGPKQSTPSTTVSQLEREVVVLVNERRKEHGLSALTLNEDLSAVARLKSKDMNDKNYFAHNSPTYGTPFEMIKKFGISYRTAGENIAKGYTTAKAVVDGWMNSQGHRENILNSKYTQIGVGYYSAGSSHTENYWTQMFIG